MKHIIIATVLTLTACNSEIKDLETCADEFEAYDMATHIKSGQTARVLEVMLPSSYVGFYCNNNGVRGSHLRATKYRIMLDGGDEIVVAYNALSRNLN